MLGRLFRLGLKRTGGIVTSLFQWIADFFSGQTPLARLRRSVREYIDAGVAFRRFKPEQEGRRAGQENRPAPDERDLDQFEFGVVERFRHGVGLLKEATLTELRRVERKQLLLDVDPAGREFKRQVQDVRRDINQLLNTEREALVSLRQEQLIRKREYFAFRRANKLTNEPNNGLHPLLAYGILVLLVLIEGMANAYFFSVGSAMGLIGGFIQATLIAVVNIVACYFIGTYLLRNMGHISRPRRVFAGCALAVALALVLGFHLLVGHYRDLLAINPDEAARLAFSRFLESPFGLQDFDTWVLVSIGLLMAAFAIIDGYRLAGDPYPGYTRMHKRYLAAAHRFEAARKSLTVKIGQIISAQTNEITNKVREAEMTFANFNESVRDYHQILQAYDELAFQIEAVCGRVLRAYRDENRFVRTAPPPAYFDTYQQLDRDLGIVFSDTTERREALMRALDAMKDAATQTKGEIQAQRDERLDQLDKYIESIEGTAQERADALNNELDGALVSQVKIGGA